MPDTDPQDETLVLEEPAAPADSPPPPTITITPTRAVTTLIEDHGATVTVVEDQAPAAPQQG